MFSSNQIDLLCNFFVKNIPSMKSPTFAGGTNSATATGRRFKKGTEFLDLENFDVEVYDPSVPGGSNTVTGRLLESWGQVLLKRWTKEEKKENKNGREENLFANLGLVRMAWGLLWEEVKLKYARLVSQIQERVEDGDVLTFSFLGLEFWGQFRFQPP